MNTATLKARFFALSIFVLFSVHGYAVFPIDTSLVYTDTIYFEDDFVDGAASYEILLYKNGSGGDTVVASASLLWPAFKIGGFVWGQSYRWQVNASSADKKLLHRGVIHRFTMAERVNSIHFRDIRIDVLKNDEFKNSRGLICIDYAKMICDRKGKTVWVMPEIPGLQNGRSQIRDLKVTAKNSLTFLCDNMPVETDLEGNILWRLPHPFVFQNDTITFHHVFTKLRDGHYYVLGNKKVKRRVTDAQAAQSVLKESGFSVRNDSVHKVTDIAVVFEFDNTGRVLWFWDADKYITDDDLNFKKNNVGIPILLTHANGLAVNHNGSKIYVSFRDLNRIIRIDKQSKKVETSFGEKYPSGEAQWMNGMFEAQHDPNLTKRNTILILNNNGARSRKVSSILEFDAFPKSATDPIRWKFELNFDTLTDGKSPSGGNVIEMKNGNIFLCGGQLNRMFEVTKKKEIVWDAFLYSMGHQDSVWQKFPQYRASWVSNINSHHFMVHKAKIRENVKGEQLIPLTVYNSGDVADDYLVEIQEETGKLLYAGKIRALKPGQNVNWDIKLKMDVERSKSLVLTVRSLGCPSRFKKDIVSF
jgi:hypothetical protein